MLFHSLYRKYLNKTISIFFTHIVFIALLLPLECLGQQQASDLNETADTLRLKLFLDCHDCDFAYFRRNLPYVDFVRDPKLSDVHVLVTEQSTASNGRSYGFNFIGLGRFADLNYKLNAISPQSDTDIETWKRLLKTTGMGLLPYLTRTSSYSDLNVKFENDSLSDLTDRGNYDNWNYWVFRLNLGADLDIQESQSDYSARGSFNVDRITEKLKFRSDISYFRSIERYVDNDTIIQGHREEIDSDIEVVFSLNPRWSVGVFSEIKSSTFRNIDFGYRIGPAIEYNIFPWDESDRRVFSFAYHVQAHYFNYRELTIYNSMAEFRATESLRLSLILRQPWGEVETRLEGLHYFHDFSKNSLVLESRISVNITKGLSIYTELDAGLIHDQLNLPAGEISREDLLLRQQQLQTAYEFSAEFGIRFTFGSIYNNIVNQRL